MSSPRDRKRLQRQRGKAGLTCLILAVNVEQLAGDLGELGFLEDEQRDDADAIAAGLAHLLHVLHLAIE